LIDNRDVYCCSVPNINKASIRQAVNEEFDVVRSHESDSRNMFIRAQRLIRTVGDEPVPSPRVPVVDVGPTHDDGDGFDQNRHVDPRRQKAL
jgi:hypothetical protein